MRETLPLQISASVNLPDEKTYGETEDDKAIATSSEETIRILKRGQRVASCGKVRQLKSERGRAINAWRARRVQPTNVKLGKARTIRRSRCS